MPPQPGMFPIPTHHKPRNINGVNDEHRDKGASGSNSNVSGAGADVNKKERKRKELAGRLGKDLSERRDEQNLPATRLYSEPIALLHSASLQLATRPDTSAAYNLRLYPLSLERSALLAQLAVEERHALDVVDIEYEEERARVEREWIRGRERVRDRLLEGIEERRRRAREEKEGEGAMGEALLDVQSRSHATRKLRNKLGGTPPPPVLPFPAALDSRPGASGAIITLATVPAVNPLSLSVDEISSPFPLPLAGAGSGTGPGTGTNNNQGNSNSGGTGTSGAGGHGSRRKPKGGGGQREAGGGLGKSFIALSACKDVEVEADLHEIRRGNKRRRATAAAIAKAAAGG